MVDGSVLTIRESDLPETLHEQAIAADVDATELFEEHIETIAEEFPNIEDGDRRAAVAFAVEETVRTAGATPDNDDEETVTDSANIEETPHGGFDLRTQTKTDGDE